MEGMTLTVKVIFQRLWLVARKDHKAIKWYVDFKHPKTQDFQTLGFFDSVPYIARETS